MSFNSWLQNLRSALVPSRGQRNHRRRGSLRAATHRPNFEVLEDRCVPSTFAAFDLGNPERGPFPSDRFTVADASQLSGRRVDLPLPNQVTRPSDYNDMSVIDTLDGFNLQPRLSVAFSGPIDVNTVNSNTVFLIKLADPTAPEDGRRPGRRHQSDRLGCRHQHAARRVGRTARPAHALRVDCDARCA